MDIVTKSTADMLADPTGFVRTLQVTIMSGGALLISDLCGWHGRVRDWCACR
jgi:hypothetical protein